MSSNTLISEPRHLRESDSELLGGRLVGGIDVGGIDNITQSLNKCRAWIASFGVPAGAG